MTCTWIIDGERCGVKAVGFHRQDDTPACSVHCKTRWCEHIEGPVGDEMFCGREFTVKLLADQQRYCPEHRKVTEDANADTQA